MKLLRIVENLIIAEQADPTALDIVGGDAAVLGEGGFPEICERLILQRTFQSLPEGTVRDDEDGLIPAFGREDAALNKIGGASAEVSQGLRAGRRHIAVRRGSKVLKFRRKRRDAAALPGTEGDFPEPVVGDDRDRRRLAGQHRQGGVPGAGERAGITEIKRNRRQCLTSGLRHAEAIFVERNIVLPLQAFFVVPPGFTVADEI